MTLIVEDGTGMEDAESYASVSDLRSYAARYKIALPAADSDCEGLLLTAAERMRQDEPFFGQPTNPAQALAFPRSGICLNGMMVAANTVPRDIFYAQLDYALAKAQGVDILPLQDVVSASGGRIISETVGPIKIDYSSAPTDAPRNLPTVLTASGRLRKYLRRGAFAIRT